MCLRIISEADPTKGYFYVVTKKHVIVGGAAVLRLRRMDGTAVVMELAVADWIQHPDGDDLAVHSLNIPDNSYRITPLSRRPGSSTRQTLTTPKRGQA